jgi:Xaa-Pro dipeptidase
MFILGPDEAPPRGDWMIKYVDSRRLQPSMDVCRGVKDHHEIDMIRRANVVSGLAHTAVLRQIGKMANEAEIAGLFLYTSMSHGAPNQSYGIIAASGENASILHYMKNNQPFGKRPLVCLDAGAEFECYASDVTRTFPLGADGEWPSDQSRDIYRVVERMQEECIGKIRKGVRFLDLHVHAHIVAIEELLKLGIFWGGTVDEIRQSGASKLFFPHGLGHHVGLDVHDVSGKSIMASRTDDLHYFSSVMPAQTFSPCTFSASLLEENMVVTVEPGIYFNRLAIESARTKAYADYIDFDVVKKYAPVGGVRIEDDILITADGYENLTTAPKGDKALEIIRNSM